MVLTEIRLKICRFHGTLSQKGSRLLSSRIVICKIIYAPAFGTFAERAAQTNHRGWSTNQRDRHEKIYACGCKRYTLHDETSSGTLPHYAAVCVSEAKLDLWLVGTPIEPFHCAFWWVTLDKASLQKIATRNAQSLLRHGCTAQGVILMPKRNQKQKKRYLTTTISKLNTAGAKGTNVKLNI